MATRTSVTMVDDIDGSTADETVAFGLDGTAYEIDLSTGNAEDLRSALARYVAAGRRTGGRRSAAAETPARTADGSARERNQEIRAWAGEQGVTLAARGRIPSHVIAAFDAGDAALLERDTSDDVEPEPVSEPVSEPAADPAAASEGDEPRGRDGLTGPERERIRAWATEEGIEVKPRGQLKKDLIANYRATAARQD